MSIKMNFHVNLVLWCVSLLTRQCLTVRECVQRPLGACKTLTTQFLYLSELYNPQPDHFLLKTSMEINLLENKYRFENYLLNEKKRRITYNLANEVIVRITILLNLSYMIIILGQKYDRLAELQYVDFFKRFSEIKYNGYTPNLPTFPYYLHLQITINGTFSICADGNNEPFLEYQLTEPLEIKGIGIEIDNQKQNNDLIAFVDCSLKSEPNSRPICGAHREDKLYGCREWFVERYSNITNLEGFQKTYRKDVLFDEFIVVDLEDVKYGWSEIKFNFTQHELKIVFRANSIVSTLEKNGTTKLVNTEKWFEIEEHPYAVRVLLTTGENNNFLNISNLRKGKIISLNLCEDMGSIGHLKFNGPKLYFDCLHIHNIIMSERPRKTIEMNTSTIEYNENGYNYTKSFIDTRDFISEPFTMYQHDFGNSTQDWCPGEPKPKLISKYYDDSLESLIETSNGGLLIELKKINAQNNATADINAAILTELRKVSATADINAAELKVISDTLATHLEQNITTVNKYYNNQLNVTEFLKFLKQK